MGIIDKILGSDEPETLLEEEHDMTPSELFVEDRTGEVKYNKGVLFDAEIKKNVGRWRDWNRQSQERMDALVSQFQDNIQITGNSMEIDWNSTEELYQDIVSHEEDIDYLSEDHATQAAAESAYEASAALEKAVRDSLHSNMDQIMYTSEIESEENTETTRTPVGATVPEAMYGFTEQMDQNSVPDGWSVGHATAIADRHHIKESLKKKLRNQSGSTTEALIERMRQGEEIEDPLEEVSGKDEYVQDRLREYGFPEDEIEAEYEFGQ